MTRTSMPLFASSSRALITLLLVSRYISTQTDFLAPRIASTTGPDPASGSTKMFRPLAPVPTVQLPWHCPPPLFAVLLIPRLEGSIVISHPVRRQQKTIRQRYLKRAGMALDRRD